MFYSQHVLTKKGPLAKIWLAAHMQSKLTKAMVFSTDLRKAVDSIISPEVPMALRLTSNLLLGVVRILHRKSKYLLQESSDAMTRLKLAFRSGSSTDLPSRPSTTATHNAITVQPPTVDSLDSPNLDLDLLPARTAHPHQSSFLAADRDITIDEFAGGLVGGMLDAFAFEPDLQHQDDIDADLAEPLLFTPSQSHSRQSPHTPSVRSLPSAEAMRADSPSHLPDPASTPRLTPALSQDEPENLRRASSLSPFAQPQLTPSTPKPPPSEPEDASEHLDAAPRPSTPTPPQTSDHSRPSTLDLQPGSAPPPPSSAQRVPQFPRLSTGTDDLVLVQPLSDPPVDSLVQEFDAPDDTEQPRSIPVEAPEPQTDLASSTPQPHAIDEPIDDAHHPVEPTSSRLSREWQPPSTPETPDTPAVSTRHVIRDRKRKATVFDDEDATELSASAFRACLNDTSDLVRGPRAPTRRRIDVSVRFSDNLGRPVLTSAPTIGPLFEQAFPLEELAASPVSDVAIDDNVAQQDELDDAARGGQSPTTPGGAQVPIDRSEQGVQLQDISNEALTRLSPAELPPPEAEDIVAEHIEGIEALNEGEVLQDPNQGEVVLPSTAEMMDIMAEGETYQDVEMVGEGSHPAGETISAADVLTIESEAGRTDEAGRMVQADSGKITLKAVSLTSAHVDDDNEEGVTEATVSARTRKMKDYIVDHMSGDELNFTQKVIDECKVSRRTAARTFYELLNLSSKKALKLRQAEAYGEIFVSPYQPGFDALGEQKEAA